MAVAVWAVFRQIEALRESVASTLEFGAIKYEKQDLEQWIRDQGITPMIFTLRDPNTWQETGEEMVHLHESMKNFLDENSKYSSIFRSESRLSKSSSYDFGVDRSGAGWHSLANFIITSAFVRLLGASEQFELDVLKSLLYYRPAGKIKSRTTSVTVSDEVLLEQPNELGSYSKPVIWTWIKKNAENNVERRKILSQVYDIGTTPEEFNGWKKTDINKYRSDLYEKRNAIAHGRSNVGMLLRDYCTAEQFIIESICKIREQCINKYKVNL